VELTWHMRAMPAPGWLTVIASGRLIADGWFDEDAEVWDSQGRLVAQSRQIARVGRGRHARCEHSYAVKTAQVAYALKRAGREYRDLRQRGGRPDGRPGDHRSAAARVHHVRGGHGPPAVRAETHRRGARLRAGGDGPPRRR